MCGWPPDCKGLFRVKGTGRLQSCVRPFGAVHMTAGPDGFRESSPYQNSELMRSLTQTGFLDPTGRPPSPSHVSTLARLTVPPSGRSCRHRDRPVLLLFAHHRPGDAGRLVRQRYRRDKPVLSGAQRYQPGIGLGRLRPKQCRVCTVD